VINALGGLMQEILDLINESNRQEQENIFAGNGAKTEFWKGKQVGLRAALAIIKRPPNQVDSVCACFYCERHEKRHMVNFCEVCGRKLEQD
jgi:hypothetical protein